MYVDAVRYSRCTAVCNAYTEAGKSTHTAHYSVESQISMSALSWLKTLIYSKTDLDVDKKVDSGCALVLFIAYNIGCLPTWKC